VEEKGEKESQVKKKNTGGTYMTKSRKILSEGAGAGFTNSKFGVIPLCQDRIDLNREVSVGETNNRTKGEVEKNRV